MDGLNPFNAGGCLVDEVERCREAPLAHVEVAVVGVDFLDIGEVPDREAVVPGVFDKCGELQFVANRPERVPVAFNLDEMDCRDL